MARTTDLHRKAFRLLLAGTAAAIAPATVATGQVRPDTRVMSCVAINRLVAEHGALVMTTGRHTFQRFVASRAFCDRWQSVKQEYAPSLEGPRCPVSYVCWEPPWGNVN